MLHNFQLKYQTTHATRPLAGRERCVVREAQVLRVSANRDCVATHTQVAGPSASPTLTARRHAPACARTAAILAREHAALVQTARPLITSPSALALLELEGTLSRDAMSSHHVCVT